MGNTLSYISEDPANEGPGINLKMLRDMFLPPPTPSQRERSSASTMRSMCGIAIRVADSIQHRQPTFGMHDSPEVQHSALPGMYSQEALSLGQTSPAPRSSWRMSWQDPSRS